MLARFVLETLRYNPGADAVVGRITAPVFLRAGELDHLAPPARVRDAASRMRASAEVVVQELAATTHIGAQIEGAKERHFGPVVAFLRRHLGVSEAEGAEADERASRAGYLVAEAGDEEASALSEPEGQFPIDS